jgi:hypothetical protein
MKKKFLLVLVIAAFAGNARAAEWSAACGKDTVQFKVKTDKKPPPLAADPEPGKAQIIFVEAVKGAFGTAPTTRYAVDGAWVGANHGASYFVVSVDPGQHHLCASRQSSIKAEKENVGITDLLAGAGQVYYYEFKIVRTEIGTLTTADGGGAGAGGLLPNTPDMTARQLPTVDSIEFTTLSDDEGRSRIKVTPLSTFVAKP